MLQKLLELKSQMNAVYPEMIEMGTESVIGTWDHDLTDLIESEINSNLEQMFSDLERIDSKLEDYADFLIAFNPKFDVSKLADIFMKISDLKSVSLMLRDTFGPK